MVIRGAVYCDLYSHLFVHLDLGLAQWQGELLMNAGMARKVSDENTGKRVAREKRHNAKLMDCVHKSIRSAAMRGVYEVTVNAYNLTNIRYSKRELETAVNVLVGEGFGVGLVSDFLIIDWK